MKRLRTLGFKVTFAAAVALLLTCVLLVSLLGTGTAAKKSDGNTVTLTAGANALEIVKNGATDYTIVYAGAGKLQDDSSVATSLRSLFVSLGATSVKSLPDFNAHSFESRQQGIQHLRFPLCA